ncbi:MAG: DUF2508 family protein [Clostridium sp.]|jgi:hypothetical protein|nr:DUF2508 family protein [Clostridium sp.]
MAKTKSEKYEKGELDIIKAIENTKLEIETARNLFNIVYDENLIEMAIYLEEAAKKRLEYLIALAKEKGIIVSTQYILYQCINMSE